MKRRQPLISKEFLSKGGLVAEAIGHIASIKSNQDDIKKFVLAIENAVQISNLSKFRQNKFLHFFQGVMRHLGENKEYSPQQLRVVLRSELKNLKKINRVKGRKPTPAEYERGALFCQVLQKFANELPEEARRLLTL